MKAIKGDLHALKKLQKQFVIQKDRLAKQAFEQKKQAALAQDNIPPVSPEDIQLFRQSLRGVEPLADTRHLDKQVAPLKHPEFYRAKRQQAEGDWHVPTPKRRTQAPTSRRIHPNRPLPDEHTYLAAGMGQDILSKLKQLAWPIEATLDLHGSTLDQAALRFDRFVMTCFEHQIKCFMIIHGKGHGSQEGKAILKPHVITWLKDLDHIAAFVPAPESLGGDGALLILIKKV